METATKVLIGVAGAGVLYYLIKSNSAAAAAPAASIAVAQPQTAAVTTSTTPGFYPGTPNFSLPYGALPYNNASQYGNAYDPTNGAYLTLTAPYMWYNNPADYPYWAAVAFAAIAANNGNQAFITRPMPLPCAGCPIPDTNVDAIEFAITQGWMPVPVYAPGSPNNTINVASVTAAAAKTPATTTAAPVVVAVATPASTAAPAVAFSGFTGDERFWQAFR